MFLNVGRSPRNDIVPEILSILDISIESFEIGVLDSLSEAQIEALSVDENESSISTHLENGVRVVLSMHAVVQRMDRILKSFEPNDFDLVVILTTGLLHDFTCACPLIHAQSAIEAAIMSLISGEQQVGLIHPLERQVTEMHLPIHNMYSVSSSFAKEGDRYSLARAVMDVADCDVIVLHSISYTDSDRRIVAKASRKPIILARRIIASAIRLLLQRSPTTRAIFNISSEIRDKLTHLTAREREVLLLICEGQSTKEIAQRLSVSPKTVEVHRSRVTSKMEAQSIRALVTMLMGRPDVSLQLRQLFASSQ
jgi:RNA polymerase sigma factor (sigma-70 family)